jgi:hypothetical protein
MAQLVDLLNACQAPKYTKIEELRHEHPYRIVELQRVVTRYGPSVTATVEEDPCGNLRKLYLPCRYNNVLTDVMIRNYNNGVSEKLALIPKSHGQIEFTTIN